MAENKNKVLMQELVKHFKENKEELRLRWVDEMNKKEFLSGLTPQELTIESAVIYDTCVECMETGKFDSAERYAHAMADRGVLRGMATEQIIGGMLTLRDVYARSLFNTYGCNKTKLLDKALFLYEPLANKILLIVAMAFVERKTRDSEEAKAYIESVIEATPDGIVIISPEGKILGVNKTVEELTGYGRKELIGKGFAEIVTEKDKKNGEAVFKECLKKDFVENFEITFAGKNNIKIPSLINIRLIRDVDGKPVAVIPVIRDMRQIRNLIYELKQAKVELEVKVSERTLELRDKIKDLEKFNRFAVDRELRIMELKKKIKDSKIK